MQVKHEDSLKLKCGCSHEHKYGIKDSSAAPSLFFYYFYFWCTPWLFLIFSHLASWDLFFFFFFSFFLTVIETLYKCKESHTFGTYNS